MGDTECPSAFTGHRLYSLNVAWSVRNEIAPTINLLLKDAVNAGVWEDLTRKYKPATSCDFFSLDARKDESVGVPQMTTTEFLGPIVMVGLGATLSMFAFA